MAIFLSQSPLRVNGSFGIPTAPSVPVVRMAKMERYISDNDDSGANEDSCAIDNSVLLATIIKNYTDISAMMTMAQINRRLIT